MAKSLEQRMATKRVLFEIKYASEIAGGEMSWDEMDYEEQYSVCERCGEIVDPEMPFEEDEEVICCDEHS